MKRSFYSDHGKRLLDVAIAVAALAILSPFALLVAAAIKLDSRGPVMYAQERIGRRGRAFKLWKFRTMVVGAERRGAGMRLERDDPRITRVGASLRRLGIDELPQLVNVLAGDMAIVGPRPALRYQVELYDDAQRGRLTVRPGMTGWAQVHGRKGIEWDRRIELDLEYVERISLARDLLIILKTIPVLLESERVPADDYWAGRARDGATRKGGSAR